MSVLFRYHDTIIPTLAQTDVSFSPTTILISNHQEQRLGRYPLNVDTINQGLG